MKMKSSAYDRSVPLQRGLNLKTLYLISYWKGGDKDVTQVIHFVCSAAYPLERQSSFRYAQTEYRPWRQFPQYPSFSTVFFSYYFDRLLLKE
jgi:hypothetical protein